ncbi:MAG: hypothetical protein LBC71_04695, partial [Oscillospiraceae bacterium]|nr:hypothetical protein [Oscillospiraceae bacterium]
DMALVCMKCPNCTAELTISDDKELKLCTYCSSKFMYKPKNKKLDKTNKDELGISDRGYAIIGCSVIGVAIIIIIATIITLIIRFT